MPLRIPDPNIQAPPRLILEVDVPCPGGPSSSLTITPGSATLQPGATQQFTANQAVSWTASLGTISPTGLYTAPNVPAATVVTITATAIANPANQATVSVSVQPVPVITVTVTPAQVVLLANGTQQFTATVTNTVNVQVIWSVIPGVGTIDAAGLYTAGSVTTPTTVTITAVSVADTLAIGQATVTINPANVVTVAITPLSVSLNSGAQQQFTATVTGSTDHTVSWSASSGTINPTGLFTAPTVSANTAVTVTATSHADPTKSAQVTFTVHPAGTIVVTISPTSATLVSGHTQQFTATVTNATPATVSWTATQGTISASGLYTAPTVTTTITVTVTASSVVDSSKQAQASVTVNPAILVTVTPASATITSAQTQQFSASVTGTTNVAVSWTASPGTISSSGLYTAPTVTTQTTATVTATSQADTSKTAHATVTVNPVVSGQLDLVQWWQLSTKATQHLVGDPNAPYHVDWVDTDPGYPANFPRGTIWAVKNKLGNPWDVLRYTQTTISHWMTENGDAADQAACQSANGTSCWLYARAYKRDLTPIPLMPRFFTPGTTITLDTPAANTSINRTTNCESTVFVVHLGPVHCITTGPHKISWGGSIDKGTGTLANGPNFDTVHGVDTIRSQYYYSQDSSQPSGYAALEDTYYVLGFGRVAWYYILRGVFQQKTVNTVLASGGHPVLNFPCGPGKPWFV